MSIYKTFPFRRNDVVATFPWIPAEKEDELNQPFEFDWKPNRNFCLTMKSSLDFECPEATNEEEGDNKFLPFAMRKSGLTVVKYYKTEEGTTKDKAWYNCPYSEYLFLWNRAGECVNGAY